MGIAQLVRQDRAEIEVEGSDFADRPDLADYATHLAAMPRRGGVAAGPEPATVSLSFAVERRWCYAGALVSQPTAHRLRVDVTAPEEAMTAVVNQVRRVLSLDVAGRGFAAVAADDPVLARRLGSRPGLRPVLFCSPYEAAVWAVVCHRLRVEQADALVRRIAERRGRGREVRGRWLPCLPAPQDLGTLDDSYGLSAVKRRRLAAVAEAALDGGLDATWLRSLPADAAVDEVRRLAGFGPFSAELVVSRGAGHPDLFPVSERHLVAALARDYDTDAAGVEAAVRRWRPYRAWGAFFCREVVSDEQ
ncbi:DNA-3-methyladenine glycosylase family protein [Saccharomonospora piscinae]|uniref:DNA-3-methyladenine glycosylase family protein n=1 Tax=Saccharomonospora piscinae TaxID=687388 RepID=UPI00207BA820|nr:DNA-3-methyladenine glycosylase 2 family protein [Saccharomonospora piscinae]